MCVTEFFSVEMLSIVWAIFGCSVDVGVVAYNEGARKR